MRPFIGPPKHGSGITKLAQRLLRIAKVQQGLFAHLGRKSVRFSHRSRASRTFPISAGEQTVGSWSFATDAMGLGSRKTAAMRRSEARLVIGFMLRLG